MSEPTRTPDRRALSGLISGVTFVAGVGAGVASSDAPYPLPGSDANKIRRYFRDNAPSARLSAAGQLISAATLAQFTASVIRLTRRAAPTSRVLQATALIGGTSAVASLATSGLYAAALTTARSDSDTAAVAMHRRAFLAGGVAHGIGFGLLVGVIGLAGPRTGNLPPAAGKLAIGSAIAGMLTPLYLVAESMAWLIPASRFTGLIVTGLTAVRLSRPHHPNYRVHRVRPRMFRNRRWVAPPRPHRSIAAPESPIASKSTCRRPSV
jgi:hypothetical protein